VSFGHLHAYQTISEVQITSIVPKNSKVQIIAPKGFVSEAISENLFGGNGMTRRKSYTYGDLVPSSPYGHVDASIGKGVASGNAGILPLTKVIDEAFEEMTVDGVRMVFQNTPGTEAPAEMITNC
jgi:alkyl sulfatase BDS1-like metallo-beta-lactamase superfamily hydrolase